LASLVAPRSAAQETRKINLYVLVECEEDIFWDITPRILVEIHRHFKGMYRLQLAEGKQSLRTALSASM
jgi:hypothetical protein